MLKQTSKLIFVCIFPLACSPTTTYSPERDAEAMQGVLGRWSASGSGITLSLCEDVERADSEAADIEQNFEGSSCQVDHVVRPERGEAHTVEHKGVGCGGCPFAVNAHVNAELTHPKLAAPLILTGTVNLGDGYEDDPYALPYRVNLSLADGEGAIGGEIDADGTLRITYFYNVPELTEADLFQLRLSGAAACP